MSGKRKQPIESISDSSSSSSSEDESAPTKPKSRRDRAHLAFQKSPTARLKSLFQASSSTHAIDIALPKAISLENSIPSSKLTFDRNAQSRSASFDISSRRKLSVGDRDALDEDLVAAHGNDGNSSETPTTSSLSENQINETVPGVRTIPNYSSSQVENEEKETVDRWRGRLWPSKAVISFVRVLTRCQPPFTFVGEKVILGKNFYRQNTRKFDQNGITDSILQREGNNLYPHWRASDLPTIGTYFDNAQAHSSAFFLLIAEESRAALSSQYDEAELEEEEEQKPKTGIQGNPDGNSLSKNKNGWLDGEIASIVEETPLGHLPDACQDPRLGSVWVVSLLIKTSNIRVAEAVSSKANANNSEGNRINNKSDDNISLSGGDIIVIHSSQWDKPILGMIQPWDPDYDIKFGSTAAKLNSALNGRNNQDYVILNIMICVDGGDSADSNSKPQSSSSSSSRSIQYDPRRSGWATLGSIYPGVQISIAVLGNTMTYIRECQALLSLRMLSARLQSAILRPPQFTVPASDSTQSSSLNRILESSKSASGQQSKHPPVLPGLEAIPRKLWSALAHSFNASQLHALQTIVSRDPKNVNQLSSPIHLLQGPPGTGKTKTILGILSLFFAGGLPPVGRAGKGQRVVAGASILSNHAKNGDDRQYCSNIPRTGSNQQNVNYLNASTERDPRKPRVLICAPSNTAVDELVYRIVTQGIFDEDGVQRTDYVQVTRIGTPNKEEYAKRHQHKYNRYKPNYPQNNTASHAHGTSATTNTELSAQEVTMMQVVESVCLETLVETKRQQLSSAVSASNAAQLSASFLKTGHVFSLTSQQARSGGLQPPQPSPMPNGFRYADLRRQVLEQVDIVCCTLSGAGSQPILEILLRIPHYQFDAVIIDEAAQTVEPSSLIPLKFNPQVVVMVGDPCQLPPTVFSAAARQANYGQSLFERLQLTKQIPLSVLATQYRMHPAIAAYPAQRFYNGHLFHGHLPNVRGTSQVIRKPFHEDPSGRFRPLVFHDIGYGVEEYDAQQSVMNLAEGHYVCALYDRLVSRYATEFTREGVRIGIIVPYRGQRRLLVRLFKERFGRNFFNSSQGSTHVDTEISTVDGFQGREKDIIIFSCVRAPNARQGNASWRGSIGFLRDWRRLNVAITRAKHALWIVGNGDWLSDKDPEWNSLIAYIKSKAIENAEQSQTLYFRFQSSKSAKNFSQPLGEYLKNNKVRLTHGQERSLSANSLKSMDTPPVTAATNKTPNRGESSSIRQVASPPSLCCETLPPPVPSLPPSFLSYPPNKIPSTSEIQSLLPPPSPSTKEVKKEPTTSTSTSQVPCLSHTVNSAVPPPPRPPPFPCPIPVKLERLPSSFPLPSASQQVPIPLVPPPRPPSYPYPYPNNIKTEHVSSSQSVTITNIAKESALSSWNKNNGIKEESIAGDKHPPPSSSTVSVPDVGNVVMPNKSQQNTLAPPIEKICGKRASETALDAPEDTTSASKRLKSGPFQLSAEDLVAVSKLSEDLFTRNDTTHRADTTHPHHPHTQPRHHPHLHPSQDRPAEISTHAQPPPTLPLPPVTPVVLNHLHKHGHHHHHHHHNVFSYNVTQVDQQVSSPSHRVSSGTHQQAAVDNATAAAGGGVAPHETEAAVSQPIFVVSSPTHVRTLATPSERLRTFYHQHQHHEAFDGAYWFDPSEEMPATVKGPFGDHFQASSTAADGLSAVEKEPRQQNLRDRALSTISLSSDSSI